MGADNTQLTCKICKRVNRVQFEKALADLKAVVCGACKTPMLRVSGEPLPGLDAEALAHPWDRDALNKLKAVPYADKILTKVFSRTLDKLAHFDLLANAIRISEKQAPRLWRHYLEAAGRIDVDPPPLFIVQNPTMNAFAAGAGAPMIAVTSGLLEGLEEREILGVLGHELTHVKLGHVLYRTLALLLASGGAKILDRLFGIGQLLVLPIRLALVRWVQMSELSADRGELVATGSAETFVRCHMLLAGGNSRYIEELDVAAFIEQADDAERTRDSDLLIYAADLFGALFARSHPLPVWRVHHGMRWARSDAFFELLAGTPIQALESK